MGTPFETHGAASWIELQTGDVKGAAKFYRNVLGWEIEEMKMEGGPTYTAVKAGGARIGGIIPAANGGGSRWMTYITVDDVEARVKKAKAAGAKVLSAPMAVPGVGRMATIEDPTGGAICLITYGA